MNFERKPFLKKVSEKVILERLIKDLEEIKRINYENKVMYAEVEDKEQVVLSYIYGSEEIDEIIDNYEGYCKEVYMDLSQLEILNVELVKTNSTLTKEMEDVKRTYVANYTKLENEIATMRLEYRELLIENVKLKESLKDTPEVNRLLELFEENIKSIAVSQKMKISKGNDKVDNRKKTVNEELLLELYNNGDNSLTNEEIGRQVGLTGAGVKDRLVKLGVYRGKKGNFGVRR